MTTVAAVTTQRSSATPLHRIWNVARLNVTNPWTILLLPWAILFAILLLNIAIWALLKYSLPPADYANAQYGFQWSGASLWIFVYMLVAGIQVMSINFPFALGYGVTRRDFFLGSAVTFLVAAAMYAIGMSVLAAIEIATNGWGLGGRMFTSLYFGGVDVFWYERLWIYFCFLVLSFFVGSAFAAVWVRWKTYGIVITFVGLAFLTVGLIALGVFSGLGEDFFAVASQLGSVEAATWSLAISAIAGLIGFLVLRRATPRN